MDPLTPLLVIAAIFLLVGGPIIGIVVLVRVSNVQEPLRAIPRLIERIQLLDVRLQAVDQKVSALGASGPHAAPPAGPDAAKPPETQKIGEPVHAPASVTPKPATPIIGVPAARAASFTEQATPRAAIPPARPPATPPPNAAGALPRLMLPTLDRSVRRDERDVSGVAAF